VALTEVQMYTVG